MFLLTMDSMSHVQGVACSDDVTANHLTVQLLPAEVFSVSTGSYHYFDFQATPFACCETDSVCSGKTFKLIVDV